VSVRVQRGDIGLVVGAVAAVVLIGGFLAMTSDSPAEDDEPAPTPTTEAPRTGLVRVTSDADPDQEWATARGAFRVECADGRVRWVDAKVTDLPVAPRYGWRLRVDRATGETAPLSARPGIRATLSQGDGLPGSFRSTDDGQATVRFTFDEERRDVVAPLVLTVLDVEPEQALVINLPALTCRRGRG
jgi:hypothetical protein